jgi:peptidoglycan hydrolase-like protein with peptidoglycan-binding domain
MEEFLPEGSRRERRSSKRGRAKWIAASVAAVLGIGGVTMIAVTAGGNDSGEVSASPTRHVDRPSTTTTSTAPTTTTTTLPPLQQPAPATLPGFTGTLGPGSDPAIVRAYQQRLTDLHFDPGPVDGMYGQATMYAVQTLQKVGGLPRTGRIGTAEAIGLAAFSYPQPLQPNGEPNRTEIDITKQVLTLYENYQVRLITTTSTGSGERYCYDSPRENPTRHICEVATTPSGRFTYTRFVKGWDKSPLGQLYQPYYFNGGIAVHGYPSVPTTPASHGCARIPMHIAEYFPLLVKVGDPVYVFGGQPAQILSSTPIPPAAPPTTAAPVPPVAAPASPPPSEPAPATPPSS